MEQKALEDTLESGTDAFYDALAKAARAEGKLTYYDGGLGGSKLSSGRAVYDLFRKRTGADIDWFTSGPEQTITRVWNEVHSGELKFDVLHAYDLAWLWYPLKDRNHLMTYVPPEAAALHKGRSDPDGCFHHFSSALLVMMYNPNRLTPDKLPKRYQDLIQTQWKNRLCTAELLRNPLIVSLLTWMYALYGPEYIIALAGQNVKVPPDTRSAVDFVTRGEADILVAGGAPRYMEGKRKGEPIAYFTAEEGAFHRRVYLGINAQTKKPNLSKLFVRFLLSREVQQIRVDAEFESSRTDVTLPDGYPDVPKYEREGKLLSDSLPYWLDIQKRYRHIALETYIDALDKFDYRNEGTHRFQNMGERVPGKVRGDGYNTEYGKPS